MINKNKKISYDAEVDILMVEDEGNEPIAYADQMGNFIIHYTQKHVPILIEILDASEIFQSIKRPVQSSELALA
jgi:hypothetical protein